MTDQGARPPGAQRVGTHRATAAARICETSGAPREGSSPKAETLKAARGAIAAHYVLLTWVYDAFSDLAYLRFRGDFGTGKTRALLTIGSLCYKPFFASGASTV